MLTPKAKELLQMVSDVNSFLIIIVRHIRTINSLNIQPGQTCFDFKDNWKYDHYGLIHMLPSSPHLACSKKLAMIVSHTQLTYTIKLFNLYSKFDLSQTHSAAPQSLTADLNMKMKTSFLLKLKKIQKSNIK